MRLARIALFILINIFNFGILEIALKYIQPTFEEAFLLQKRHLMENSVFKAGLAAHGISACLALLCCSFLALIRIENKKPALHRFIGKVALVLIFLVVVPGGLVLSYYASGGVIGKLLFFLLSVYTAYLAYDGLKKIREKKIVLHQLIMTELMTILCSAIILRLLLLLFYFIDLWSWQLNYCLAAALSWLPTMFIFALLKNKTQNNFLY